MLKAHARIAFPAAADYFPTILEALEAHKLPVHRLSETEAHAGEGAEISLKLSEDRLDVSIACADGAMLNSLRYSVTSLIDFNARDAAPHVVWQGDTAGETLPADLQVLRVVATEALNRSTRRIWFAGGDLSRYDTVAQLHCRLLFKSGRGMPQHWPMMTDEGRIRWPEGRALLDTRVYTIRAVDLEAGRVAIDFHLGHSGGPATRWARDAQPGDGVGFIGPAAQGLVPAQFHVFAGDETGLPGIARCVEALAPAARGVALIEVDGPEDRQEITSPPGVELRWLYRNGAAPGTTPLLADAFNAIVWPDDLTGVALWCGAERDAFVAILRRARALGVPREKIVAFAHWRRGMSEPEIAAAGSNAVRDTEPSST